MNKMLRSLLVVGLSVSIGLIIIGGCTKNIRPTVEKRDRKPPAEAVKEGETEGKIAEEGIISERPIDGGVKKAPEEIEFASIDVLRDIYFDFDKSNIKLSERELLNKNAEWLRNNPNARVQIEGHCDERGTKEYNIALAERRIISVRNYLLSLGIAPDRLFTISYGEEKPVCNEHDESCWWQNRRAHFVIAK